MPSNKDFIMSILVGGVELPEYEKDGEIYVESNLFTPVSYTQSSEELVQGEIEKQNWPVTPYQIKITAMPTTPYSYYKVFVDGQKATQIAVQPGRSSISEGFYDGSTITEFLFSLPRFPQNKKDRMDKAKASKVGFIEVECWNSKVTGYKKPLINNLDYSQANKKDSTNVTNGEYMMATTKVGRSLRTTQKALVEDWTLFNVRSRLSVRYVMGHSLVDMGFKLRPIRIPVHRIPASVMVQPQKRKRHTARKSMTPRLNIGLGAVIEEVLEIESEEDDLILGDFVPAKKLKEGEEDALVELTATDEAVAGTSRDGNTTEVQDEIVEQEEKSGEDVLLIDKDESDSVNHDKAKSENDVTTGDKVDDDKVEGNTDEGESTDKEKVVSEETGVENIQVETTETSDNGGAGRTNDQEEYDMGNNSEMRNEADSKDVGGNDSKGKSQTGPELVDEIKEEVTDVSQEENTNVNIGDQFPTDTTEVTEMINKQVDEIQAMINAAANGDLSEERVESEMEKDNETDRNCENDITDMNNDDKSGEGCVDGADGDGTGNMVGDGGTTTVEGDDGSVKVEVEDSEKQGDGDVSKADNVDDELDDPVIVNPRVTLGDELVLE